MNINLKVAALLVGMGLTSLVHAQQGAFQVGGPNAAAASQAGALSGSTSGAGAAAGIELNQHYEASQPLERSTLQYDGTYTIKNVPNIAPPNIFPTAPCMGASSLGGAVAGFGIGGGTSWIAENCEHRENARLLHAMGDVPNAKVAMCMQTTMANHPMCQAMAPKPAAQPAKVSRVDPRDQRVITGSEQARDQLRTKSMDDAAFTQAALSQDPQAARCNYAKQIGDTILQSRFGCNAGK